MPRSVAELLPSFDAINEDEVNQILLDFLPSYVEVSAAEVQAGHTIVRTSNYTVVKLVETLGAAGTSSLPAAPINGDVVRAYRVGKGFFDWTISGVVLPQASDRVAFQRVAGSWQVVDLLQGGKTGVRRRSSGGDARLEDSGTVQVFTAASTYNVPDAIGTSTDFFVQLRQRGTSAIVSLTLGGGLTHVSGPTATTIDGSTLWVQAVGSSQIQTWLVEPLPVSARDYDRIAWNTGTQGTTLSAAEGKHYVVSGSSTLVVTWSGANVGDEKSAVVEKVSGGPTINHQAAAAFTLNGAASPGTKEQKASKVLFVRSGTDFDAAELRSGEQREPFTFFDTLTVAGVRVANGTAVSGVLTMATHGGGVFNTGGIITAVPNQAGFTVTLKITNAGHTISAGGAAYTTLAVGDIVTIMVFATNDVKMTKAAVANVINLPTS